MGQNVPVDNLFSLVISKLSTGITDRKPKIQAAGTPMQILPHSHKTVTRPPITDHR